MSEIKLLPCPFCGGAAVECWGRTRCEPTGQSWIGGEARAHIACGKCGAEGRRYTRDCGPRDASMADVDDALIHARILWNARPQDAIADLRQTIIKHYKKSDREDRSYDWNSGFNDCCEFILQHMLQR